MKEIILDMNVVNDAIRLLADDEASQHLTGYRAVKIEIYYFFFHPKFIFLSLFVFDIYPFEQILLTDPFDIYIYIYIFFFFNRILHSFINQVIIHFKQV